MQNHKKTDAIAISDAPVNSKEIVAKERDLVNVDKPDLDNWLARRDEFKQKIVSKMQEIKHFHKMKFNGKEVQVLAKGGAEMVASAFNWKADFVKDAETWEMLGSQAGIVCYICNLKNGEFVGQGRGARNVRQDGGDANKTIKMAQKSAFIDAVLRASGLSDLFTQDLDENHNDEVQVKLMQTDGKSMQKATPKQRELIKSLAKQKKIGHDQLFAMAKGLTPSQFIQKLIDYKPAVPEEVIEEKV